METRQVGTTDVQASVIALGCWPMGGGYWGEADDQVSMATIDKALELGVTFLDTAPAYGRGHSEEVVGKALVGRRDEAVISTKASGRGHSLEDLREKLEGSLERLQTDYVDVYFIHWPSREEPLGRTIEAMETLREEGLIRAIGVSNFDVPMLQMAAKYGTVDILQPPYNFVWRFIEEDILPYCRKHNIGISTYSSLAQGLMTGTIGLNTTYSAADQRPRSVLWKPENFGKVLYTVERLRPIAKDLGVTMPQLALRWIIEQEGITTALVGARTPQEIEDNAGTVGWDLPEDVKQEMQDISDELYYSMPYYYDMWENWSTWQRRGPQREM
jgi:aryl-alcohol dehydrogenase-like predicted oxidoreductase